MQKHGTPCTVAGNFYSAAAVYSKAISVAKVSEDLQPDAAVLHCNRSAANMRLGQFFAVRDLGAA